MDYSILLAYPKAAQICKSIDANTCPLALADLYSHIATHRQPNRDYMLAIEVHIRMAAQVAFTNPDVLQALSIVEKALDARKKLDRNARARANRAAKKAA